MLSFGGVGGVGGAGASDDGGVGGGFRFGVVFVVCVFCTPEVSGAEDGEPEGAGDEGGHGRGAEGGDDGECPFAAGYFHKFGVAAGVGDPHALAGAEPGGVEQTAGG